MKTLKTMQENTGNQYGTICPKTTCKARIITQEQQNNNFYKLLVESGFILLNWNGCRFDIGTVGEEDYAGLTCGNGG